MKHEWKTLDVDRQRATVLPLHPAMDVQARHWLLGIALERVREFAKKYDLDANPDVLMRAVEKDFTKDGEREFLIIVALRGVDMVAHLLANVSVYHGNRYVYVSQMELDEHCGVTLEQERSAFEWIRSWAKEVGATGIRAAVPTKTHVRKLQMLHGGEPFLTTVKLGM